MDQGTGAQLPSGPQAGPYTVGQTTEQVEIAIGGGAPARSDGHAQLAWVLALAAILFEVPVAVVLVRSLLGATISVSGVVASLFLLPGLPLFAGGLYQLFSGQIVVRQDEGVAALLRRPTALLLVGLVLLLAAGLAAG